MHKKWVFLSNQYSVFYCSHFEITGEIWNHHQDKNDWLEFHISSLHLSLKYLQNLLYRGKIIILCLWHLLWNQHQTMIVACHLYSVWIRYQYVYHLHYCSKDHHHYSSCCHCCYFRGDCFCGCYALILAFPFYPSYVIVLMSPLFCSCFPSPIPLLLPFFIAFNLLFALFT